MRSLITLVMPLILLWGCNSTQVKELPAPPINLAYHPQFQAQPVESLEEIFALDSSMQAQLNNAFATRSGNLSATKRLMMLILENGDKSVRYQSGATLTAAQTYKQLNANCLSLSILAFSMAEHLGLKGQFQRVHIPEYWALNRGYNLLTGHINLRLYQPRRRNEVYELYNAEREVIVDFAPDISDGNFKTTEITKERVAAMFYNNKGAAALVEQDYERAYSYFYAATQMDPYYSGGWGNLGILYRLINDFERAESAYQYAINIDKDNNTALGNLAILYRLTERTHLAEDIERKLAQLRRNNPYYHIALGNDSLVQKQYAQALNHFRKARELDERIHESYFGMAHTYYLMGDIKATRKYLLMAQKRAHFDYDKLRYRGKLASLELIAKNR
ncbi:MULTISPECIES: tetratricopeptide repeat protein [unclassified Pseudoalteromonas]|uniref:tetratricopeptide repeat protein n=1 Tax=unclassified Pseudoalteromonas TaxID=194690 RepID=UPI000CF5E7E4|nr:MULTISPECIES: tetratricopeptide repeat protein [unclassified Pseudoalteromonas]MBS3796288.1 tetratricopeptide repeat protein [Pseudoalteromonas sp. BDTF-M6]